jgi:hypothetical protein
LWKYVNMRRLLILVEESIDRGIQWVVFEPNRSAPHLGSRPSVRTVAPNKRLQRTRRPRIRSGRSLRSLGSPLKRYPLGDVVAMA